jgi:hypothetical protein
MKMIPICCPETSITNYKSTLHNIPEEQRFYLQSNGSLENVKYQVNFTECDKYFYVKGVSTC